MQQDYPAYIKAPAILLIITFLILAKSVLVPIIIAVFFALLLIPACELLEQYKFPRPIAAGIMVVFSLALVAGVVALFIHKLPLLLKRCKCLKSALMNILPI